MADFYDGIDYVAPETVIAQLNFLRGINDPETNQILAQSIKEIRLHARATLHQQDTPITHVWILLEGEILQQRRELDAQGRPRQYLEHTYVQNAQNTPDTPDTPDARNAMLGVYDYLFDTTTYRTRARAVVPCRLLAIEIAALSRLVFRFPSIRKLLAPLEIIERLLSFPLVGAVEPVGLGLMADALKKVKYAEGEAIYKAGDNNKLVYLLNHGQVEVKWIDGRVSWLGNGALFGLASGIGATNAASDRTMAHAATATMTSDVYTLSHADFYAITGFSPDAAGLTAVEQREQLIDHLPIFSQFSETQRRQLTGYFSHNYYPTNHLLIQQNEQADSLWVLMPGGNAIIRALDDTGKNMLVTVAASTTYFSETALLGEIAQDSTVEADAGSEWLRLHWRDFDQFDNVDPDDLRAMLEIKSTKQPALVGKTARKKYPWLQPGEAVVYFSRRHWVAFIRKNALTLIFLAFLLAFLVLGWIIPGFQGWIQFSVIILLILSVLALIWGIIDYRNDWLVVTNRRVVYQEKLLFVQVWRKEAPLEAIQNVNFLNTFFGKWLKYGTLVVQTAGTTGAISFNYTTNIDTLRKVIKRQQDQRKQHTVAQSKMQIHRELEKRLGLLLAPPSRVHRDVPRREAAPAGPPTRSARRRVANARAADGNRMVWRKHWMALLPQIGWAWIIVVFLLLMGLVFWATTDERVSTDLRSAASGLEILVGLLVLVFLARLAWVIADWRNDTYEVSDTDVVNVHKQPFGLSEDRRAAGLARVQNVEMRIPSPIHWLLDYGNVTIQTAAEFGTMEFYAVPNPRAVAEEILARMERFRKRQEEDDARRRAEDLPDWFEMYHRLDPSTGDGRSEQAPNQQLH